MAIVTGDRYVERLQKFLEEETESLLEETMVLKLNPAGLHYIHLRLESLRELERMLSGAPVDYLRAYVSDLGDYRALEQLRRILRILTSVKVVSTLPSPARDPTPLSLIPFGRLKVWNFVAVICLLLRLRACSISVTPWRRSSAITPLLVTILLPLYREIEHYIFFFELTCVGLLASS